MAEALEILEDSYCRLLFGPKFKYRDMTQDTGRKSTLLRNVTTGSRHRDIRRLPAPTSCACRKLETISAETDTYSLR